MSKMQEKRAVARRARRFLTEGIWDVELRSLSWLKRLWVNTIRVLHLIYKGFRENECPLHASALTYISLMSIVPVLAFALAVLRGLGAGKEAEQRIMQSIEQMPEQFRGFVSSVLDYVSRTNFATLGGVGLALLLVTVIIALGRVEKSFNCVWGVSSSRSFLRKISGYFSILIVVPILVMAAATINTILTSPALTGLIQERLGAVSLLYAHSKALTPLVATWAAFSFLYKFMPNTRVRPVPAVLSGIIGGSLWIGWQWLYINLQVGVNQYNMIYGTFASIPIFLIWLYISWQIVLLGAEVGFAFQNYATYKLEQRGHAASPESRIMLALSIMCRAARSMSGRLPPFEIDAYARAHLIPVRLINEVVEELVAAGLLVRVSDTHGRYVLARLPDDVEVGDVADAILRSGAPPQSMGLDKLHPAFGELFEGARPGAAGNLRTASLTDLVRFESSPSDAAAGGMNED